MYINTLSHFSSLYLFPRPKVCEIRLLKLVGARSWGATSYGICRVPAAATRPRLAFADSRLVVGCNRRVLGTPAGGGPMVAAFSRVGVKTPLASIGVIHCCFHLQLHAQLCHPHVHWPFGRLGACWRLNSQCWNPRSCLWDYGMLSILN